MTRFRNLRSHPSIGRIACLVVVLIGTVSSLPAHDSTVKLVHVVFRHGDRTPDDNGREMYPTDPYRTSSFWPMGLGQLTNDGKRREYKLGTVLRDRYVELLGKIYEPNAINGRSSDYDRTKMSLQLVLAALFPPEAAQKWHRGLNWQPIPTGYIKRAEDNLFLSDECPLYLAEYDRVMRTPEVENVAAVYKELMGNLTRLTGRNMTTLTDLYYLYHTLMAESSMDLALPEWAYGVFPYGALWDATVLWYETASYNTLLQRLYAGPILREVAQHIRRYLNRTAGDREKMYFYSGHETNIASILKAYSVYEPHVPEYSSAVFIELIEQGGRHYVKILYYKGIPSVVVEYQLPGCDLLCPVEEYLRLTDSLIPSDEEMVCKKDTPVKFEDDPPHLLSQEMLYNVIRTSRSHGQS